MITKLDHVDSLRGIAILLVILVHVAQSVEVKTIFTDYGQMGVQLFFVVSAFTLSLSMSNSTLSIITIKSFFIRRFFRIAPLYYFGITLYITYYFIFSLKLPDQYTIINVLSNVLFIHSFIPSANNVIVPGGWSIGTEMIFYLIFPIIFFMTIKKNFFYTIPLLIMTFLIIDYFIINLIEYYTGHSIMNHNILYYSIFNQISVFMVGYFLFFIYKNKFILKYSYFIDFMGFLIFTVLSIKVWEANFPYAFIFIPLLSAVSFLFLHNIFCKLSFLNINILKKIGELSFSIYIIHFVFAWDLSRYIKETLSDTFSQNHLLILCFVVTLCCSLIIATITNTLIEKPGITFGKKLMQSGVIKNSKISKDVFK